MLVVGLAALQTANFVAGQFDRSAWLGWLTLAVAAVGFGLLFAAVARELRGLFGLTRIDRLRAALGSGDASRIHGAARHWAASLPEAAVLVPAIDAANDPDAILALLARRAGRRPAGAVRRRWAAPPRSRWLPASPPPRRRRWRCCWSRGAACA